MKILTICFGIVLTLLGADYYYVTGMSGIITLMPAVFGIAITLLGFLQGRWEHRHPLYGSLILAILIFIGSLRALLNLFRILTGNEIAEPTTILARSLIGVLCVVYIALGLTLIKDFWHDWKAFGEFLGNLLARIVLTVFYFTVFVPFALVARFFSDPLQVKSTPSPHWRPRTTGDQKLEDIFRQF
jgi:MFS family permease